MILLDLPPEVFDRIIMHLTKEVGIEATWKKYRNVCRYQGLYLCYRVGKSENGRLPDVLRNICKAVCLGLPDHDEQTRQKSARILCEAITTYLHEWCDRCMDDDNTWDDTPPLIHYYEVTSLERTDLGVPVAVAAAFGNLQGVRAGLEDTAYHIWDETCSWYWDGSVNLDSPLELAAAGGHLELVRTFLKYFEQNHRRMMCFKWVPQFRKAITRSLQYRHASIVLLLLRVYDAYGPPIPSASPDVQKWNELAMKTRNLEVITQVRNMRWDYTNKAFREACECNDLAAVRMFVEEGLVSLHSISSGGEPLTPIEEAVESGSVESVQLLLEMGADPDAGNEDYGTPSSRAIESVQTEIVRVLLQYGAEPGGLAYVSISESMDRLDERYAIRLMLKEAQNRHKFYVRSEELRTDLTIDAEDLFMRD
ncbi:hypothetical protein E8E13_007350 [Curvularia kusanoi]|uniref:Ankyrin repeat protein n=1 Tax=Curvularia kusanoi TaxID=90978 RepID=A0A9P4WBX3_CURKU|nr:hypothetical protein E8E13_007350 [Curvularia kusanoi]